jgi:hypothetical protein
MQLQGSEKLETLQRTREIKRKLLIRIQIIEKNRTRKIPMKTILKKRNIKSQTEKICICKKGLK